MSEKKYIFLSTELLQRTDFTKPRKYKRLIKEFQTLSHITDPTWIQKCLELRNFGVTTKESSGELYYKYLMDKGQLYFACFSFQENSESDFIVMASRGIPFMFVSASKLHCEKIMIKTDEKGFFRDCEVICKEREVKKTEGAYLVSKSTKNCMLHDKKYTPEVMSRIRSIVKQFYSHYRNIIEVPIFHYSNLLDILSWIEMHQRYMEQKANIDKEKKSNVTPSFLKLFGHLYTSESKGPQ